jgi:hypothetical protein
MATASAPSGAPCTRPQGVDGPLCLARPAETAVRGSALPGPVAVWKRGDGACPPALPAEGGDVLP